MTKAKGGYKIKENGKKDTGHPTVMTPETIAKLEQAFSLGCTDMEACFFANIGKSALYNYQKEHPEFVERKEALKEKMIFAARTVIANSLADNDKDTAKWLLERKRKQEFSTRIENTGADGEPLQMPVLNILPVRIENGNS